MTVRGQPLNYYPIWISNDSTNPLKDISQGNQSDPNDLANTHTIRDSSRSGILQWAYDFPTKLDTPVHAVSSGTVYSVETGVPDGVIGFGNVVTVESKDDSNNTYYVTYAHLSSSNLTKGAAVTAGVTEIGKSGEEGSAAHLHIHFGTGTPVLRHLINGDNTYSAYVADGSNDTFAPAYLPELRIDFNLHGNTPDRVYNGTDGIDYFTGNNKGDTVYGGAGDDNLTGGAGADHLYGQDGDDILKGGGGNDIIDGGAGINTAVYTGRPVDHVWTKAGNGSWTIVDNRSGRPDGDDTLTNIQFLKFATGDVIALSPTVVSRAITLNDSAMDTNGGMTVVSTFHNTGNQNNTLYSWGPITSNGFVVTNKNRTDFAFHSWNSEWATTFGYFFDGQQVLEIPQNGNLVGGDTNYSGTDTITVEKQDKTGFSLKSVKLDTFWAEGGIFVTFNGKKTDGSTVNEIVQLDKSPGLQISQFGDRLSNLQSLSFTASDSILFDDLTFDPSPPTAAITLLTPRAPFTSGASSIGKFSNVAGGQTGYLATVTGVAVGDSTVTVFDNGSPVGTASVDSNANWSFSTGPLLPGVHSFTATDTVGSNTSQASSAVDIVVLSAPTGLALSPLSDSGILGDNITNITTPVITGNAEPWGTVTLFDDATTVGNATVATDGTWSITTNPLADGAHTLTATNIDVAGNVSTASPSLVITLDTLTPSGPGRPTLSAGSDTGAKNDNVTSITTPVITGTGETGDTVTLFDGSIILGTLDVRSDGTWSVTTPTLTDGLHHLTAKQADLAGNTSSASDALDLTIRLKSVATDPLSVSDLLSKPSNQILNDLVDFDGNHLGGVGSWLLMGQVDIQGDGDLEYIMTNTELGRWATLGPDEFGIIDLANHSWGGDTRVVGTYIDPLIPLGVVKQGTEFDSQIRFQKDLEHGNISSILGAGDFNGDGLQEVYFGLDDKTAVLHAHMHADGNIQYANYQVSSQAIDYLQGHGFGSETWGTWGLGTSFS
jgi:hypothetical protein